MSVIEEKGGLNSFSTNFCSSARFDLLMNISVVRRIKNDDLKSNRKAEIISESV